MRDLFDGETLRGWGVTDDPTRWTVDGGTIRCKGGEGGDLYTVEEFDDFELALEFKMTPGANTGVFFRWFDISTTMNSKFEIQIIDPTSPPYDEMDLRPRQLCGGLYDLEPPDVEPDCPPGEWHRMEIVCDGPRIRASVNGTTTVDVDIDRWDTPGENPDGTENKYDVAWAETPREGRIGLQNHGDEAFFRDIRIEPL